MKKKWLGIRIALSTLAALGWWGLLYPELSLTPDTVTLRIEEEDGTFREQPLEWDFDGSLLQDLLNAGPGKITFRSKLFTDFGLFLEALHNGNQ